MAIPPVVMAGIAIAGGVASAIGSIQQGQSAQAMASYNARLAEQGGQIAQQRAALEALNERRRGHSLISAQRAAAAAAGVQVSEGSPLELAADTAAEAEWRANLAEWEGKIGVARARAEAEGQRFEGRLRRDASYGAAAAALLGGAARGFDLMKPASATPPDWGGRPNAAGGDLRPSYRPYGDK